MNASEDVSVLGTAVVVAPVGPCSASLLPSSSCPWTSFSGRVLWSSASGAEECQRVTLYGGKLGEAYQMSHAEGSNLEDIGRTFRQLSARII